MGGTQEDGHRKMHSRLLPALRPDMKGLFREMQGIVIRAFLLLIMVLSEAEEEKKTKHVDVLFIIICGLWSIYNHENHPLTKTAPVIVPVSILRTI